MDVPSTMRFRGSMVKAVPLSDQSGPEPMEIVNEAVVGPERVKVIVSEGAESAFAGTAERKKRTASIAPSFSGNFI
jgi:hypothetical protein